MKVTLSFEESSSSDVSVIVDALRASTTITLGLDKFKRIIPCFTPEEALKLKEKIGGTVAGERMGKQLEGFDIGNSPSQIMNLEASDDTLILTTSNGTRILENMNSQVLVGSMVNARAAGLKSIQLANNHIDVVMAGVRGEFAIEDFLASGEILYWISRNLKTCQLSEYAKSAILASRDYKSVKKTFLSSKTGERLAELGFKEDVELSSLKNITDNVAIYHDNELTLYI